MTTFNDDLSPALDSIHATPEEIEYIRRLIGGRSGIDSKSG